MQSAPGGVRKTIVDPSPAESWLETARWALIVATTLAAAVVATSPLTTTATLRRHRTIATNS
jgi:hypothetical protein